MELAVVFQVVADLGILRHADVLVENGPPQFRAPADIAVVQDHALIDYRAGMHAHAARQNGGTHHPAREKTAAGDDTVDGLPAAVGVVKSELGRRIGIAGAAQGPLRVV